MPHTVLRNFVKEAIVELRRDDRFLALLRDAGIGHTHDDQDDLTVSAHNVFSDWLEDFETRHDTLLPTSVVSWARRFTDKRWAKLLRHFRGDADAASTTMHNQLNARYASSMVGGR